MANELPDMTLKAIGIVSNGIRERPEQGWSKVISDIVINSHLTEALDGLEEFSHIIVLYWIHWKATTRQVLMKIHPRHREELPLVGLFATRSSDRPNLVGKATARLLQRQGNVLKVQRLDAIDGTPVIDIKPYIPRDDMPTDVKVPQWVAKL